MATRWSVQPEPASLSTDKIKELEDQEELETALVREELEIIDNNWERSKEKSRTQNIKDTWSGTRSRNAEKRGANEFRNPRRKKMKFEVLESWGEEKTSQAKTTSKGESTTKLTPGEDLNDRRVPDEHAIHLMSIQNI